jgi:hypothetical protein
MFKSEDHPLIDDLKSHVESSSVKIIGSGANVQAYNSQIECYNCTGLVNVKADNSDINCCKKWLPSVKDIKLEVTGLKPCPYHRKYTHSTIEYPKQ